MPLETYQLPNFLALLPKKPGGEINLYHKEVETAFKEWMEKKFHGRSKEEVYECDTPLLVSLAYPLASYEQLMGILNYFAAGFILDDILDRSTSENVQVHSQLWMKALRDVDTVETIPHPLFEFIRSELLRSIRAATSALFWPRFIEANEELVIHMVQETHNREIHKMLDIPSYVALRRWSIGVHIGLVIIGATRCLYIPDAILKNQAVQKMENAIVDIMIISNDIFSFKKEYAFDGAPDNLLTVMRMDPETAHLDFQGRLNHSEKLFKAAVECFHVARRELPSINPGVDQDLSQYADGLIDLAVGNLQWSLVNLRYSAFMNDEDRRNNIMRLDLE